MESNESQDIVVTHVVNPYGIWAGNLSEYCTVDSTNILLDVHMLLEKEYQVRRNSLEEDKFQIGQVVGVYYKILSIWARGIIDDMYGSKSMLIWLTDFGYHLHKVTLPELVIPLGSEACDIAPIMIHKLGLYGILPCQIVSKQFGPFEVTPCKYWLPSSIKIIEDNLRNATSVKFFKKCEKIHADGMIQHFGKILVQFKNHEVDLSDILVRQKVAIYDEKAFMKGFSSLQNILRIDRIVPHTEKHLNIGRQMLHNFKEEPTRGDFIIDWTKTAAKAVQHKLLAPVEDNIL